MANYTNGQQAILNNLVSCGELHKRLAVNMLAKVDFGTEHGADKDNNNQFKFQGARFALFKTFTKIHE